MTTPPSPSYWDDPDHITTSDNVTTTATTTLASLAHVLDQQKSALYQALLWIDPPQETLTPHHLTQAFDLLCDTIIMTSVVFENHTNNNNNHNHNDDNDNNDSSNEPSDIDSFDSLCSSLHPRQQQLAWRLLFCSNTTTNTNHHHDHHGIQLLYQEFISLQDDWKEVQCDLIRALVVTCFLLLEITPQRSSRDQHQKDADDKNDDDPTTTKNDVDESLLLSPDHVKTLQQTVERCYSLLDLFQTRFSPWNNTSNSNKHTLSLPSSHYPLLQGAMEGPHPWIPRSKHERQFWWIELETSRILEQQQQEQQQAQQQKRKRKRLEPNANGDHDDELDDDGDNDDKSPSINNNNYHDIELELDPTSLQEDEQTLMQMARRPIPYQRPPDEHIVLGTLQWSDDNNNNSNHHHANHQPKAAVPPTDNNNLCYDGDDDDAQKKDVSGDCLCYLLPRSGLIHAMPMVLPKSNTPSPTATTTATTATTAINKKISFQLDTRGEEAESLSHQHNFADHWTQSPTPTDFWWAITPRTTMEQSMPQSNSTPPNGSNNNNNSSHDNKVATHSTSNASSSNTNNSDKISSHVTGSICIRNVMPIFPTARENSHNNNSLVSLSVTIPNVSNATATAIQQLEGMIRSCVKQRQFQRAFRKEWSQEEYFQRHQEVQTLWYHVMSLSQQ